MLQCIPCAKLWSEKDSAHMFVDEIIWIFHSCIIETVSLYECECRIQVLRDLEIICIFNKLRTFRQRLKLALLIKVTWPRIRSKLIWREISYRMRIWRNHITIFRKKSKEAYHDYIIKHIIQKAVKPQYCQFEYCFFKIEWAS